MLGNDDVQEGGDSSAPSAVQAEAVLQIFIANSSSTLKMCLCCIRIDMGFVGTPNRPKGRRINGLVRVRIELS